MDPPTLAEVAEVAEVAEKAEVAEVKELPEKPARDPIERSVPILDANFWGSMLQTKREMDKAAMSLRYANLVVLK
jgi:hypothetical protein